MYIFGIQWVEAIVAGSPLILYRSRAYRIEHETAFCSDSFEVFLDTTLRVGLNGIFSLYRAILRNMKPCGLRKI